MPASTIAEVISALDGVIYKARKDKSRLGYFPALYRKVTIAVQEGIRAGEFEDGPRMEKLDVTFANRYLDVLDARRSGAGPTGSWNVAFDAAQGWWPIVLQHLLLGMNAHINLDLGIAAAQTCPGDALPGLHNDFNRINGILSSLVDGVKAELTEIWPILGILDRLAGTADDRIIDFSMQVARDHAWRFAEKLAPLDPADQEAEIARVDAWIALFGRRIWKPNLIVRGAFMAIRLGERGSVPKIINLLM